MLQGKKESAKIGKVLDRSKAIYIRAVVGKGRGLFANIPFKSGDVIERAPTWGFDNATAELLDRTGLFEYYFVRHDGDVERGSMAGYVVFGLTSLANHSSNPNARIEWADEASGAWASIVATKDIKVDEEITHHYTNVSVYPPTIKFID
ncbi:SET domain-containing protein-lysine N-methyltransferase [Bradyrhizobium sp. U531]|uniref:SET domain-containing protein-lysine N-methyltransferase n=1 Tax=Bradyrhizobium sp. U531 TaxID=3053458 RepID=UPI003F41F4F5